jgi:hypothetical protein
VVSNRMLHRRRKSNDPEEIALSNLHVVWELFWQGKIFAWKNILINE